MEIKFTDYGQMRDINATEEEIRIFELLKEVAKRDIELVRRSDSYVTAVLGEWDLARFKYTQRARWVSFPAVEAGAPKHKITAPDDAVSFADLMAESLSVIDKYQN